MVTNNAANYSPTQYNVQVGGASGTLSSVAPSATSGVPLISQGSSANPAFGTAVVGGGGTGIVTTTAYGVLCGGTTATGNFQNAGAGTSGQILKSGGAAALPSWVAPSSVGGSLVLIQSQTAASSASIIFTGLTTYSILFCTISQAQPVTNTQQLQLLISQDGSTYLTTGYTSGINYHAYNSTTYTNFNATTYAPITNTMTNTGICSAFFYMFNMNTGANWKITGQSTWNDSGAATTVFGDIGGQGNTGIVALKFQYASGNIFTGTFTLYGMATS